MRMAHPTKVVLKWSFLLRSIFLRADVAVRRNVSRWSEGGLPVKKMSLLFLLGSLLLVTPLLMDLSQGGEKSLFSAMSTLSEVKDTLEEKRLVLQKLEEMLRSDPRLVSRAQLEDGRRQYAYAKDVYRLAKTFLEVSRKRYPSYASFWNNYERGIEQCWKSLAALHAELETNSTYRNAPLVDMKQKSGKRGGGVQASRRPHGGGRTGGGAAAARSASAPAASADRGVSAARGGKESGGVAGKNAAPPARDVLKAYREAYQYYVKGGKGNLERACSMFRSILRRSPQFHLARYWLARALLERGRIEEARAEARRLLHDQPNLQIARELVRKVGGIDSAASKGAEAGSSKRSSGGVIADARGSCGHARVASGRAAPARRTPAAVRAGRRAVVAAAARGRDGRPSIATRSSAPVRKGLKKPAPVPARAAKTRPGVCRAARSEAGPSPRRQAHDNDLRPLAVMVENSRRARPQSGLSYADIVYEMPVEGGITRFMTVFLNPDPIVREIGPVRSARHYFVQQVPALDAMYAHCGGSVMGYAEIAKAGIDEIDEIHYGYGFWRITTRRAPHNLYTGIGKLLKAFRRRGVDVKARPGTNKHPFPIAASPTYDSRGRYVVIDLPYTRRYHVSYVYDPARRTYLRYMNGEPHVDALNGEQIAAADVVIVRANSWKVLDKEGRLDLGLTGEGEAQVHVGGRVLAGRWIRGSRYSLFSFMDSEGRKIEFNPGPVWIQVLLPMKRPMVAYAKDKSRILLADGRLKPIFSGRASARPGRHACRRGRRAKHRAASRSGTAASTGKRSAAHANHKQRKRGAGAAASSRADASVLTRDLASVQARGPVPRKDVIDFDLGV